MLRSWIFAVLITFLISLSAYASDLNEELLDAALNGRTSEVLTLLDAGAEVNAKDPLGRTALLLAIASGHVDTVQALVNAGASVNVKDWDGSTVLMQAAYGEHSQIVQALLETGADVNMRSPRGSTALIYAARKGRTENVQILLDSGAEVDAACEDGSTALLEAASLGHTETARVLLEAGANVNWRGENGSTALMRAAEIGMTELVQILLNAGADVNLRDLDSRTALMRAKSLPEIIDLLKKAERMKFEWFQTGNTLSITSLQFKQSSELEDNRLGQMASLKGDISTGQDVHYFVNQNTTLGLKRARLSIDWFDWGEVDWSKEEYSKYSIEPNHDKAITGLVNNDIKITYTLVFWDVESSGKEEEEGYSRFKTEDEIQRYLDYAQFIVSHFKGKIEYYEILNEPITGSGTQQSVEVADYINLVKRVVPAIRQEDSETKIVIGAIGTLSWPDDYDYLLNILNSEVMPLVDGISFHPMHGVSPDYELKDDYYQYPYVVQEIKDVASSHGFKGEYFADELVWRTPEIFLESEPWLYSKIVAAKYYARGIIINLGLDLNTGLALESLEELPLMVKTIRNLCTVMAGAKPITLSIEIESEATNISNYCFSLSNGDKLIALWTDGVAVDEDPGVNANLTLDGFTTQNVMSIDVLEGYQQPMITSAQNGNLVIQNLIVRDYPLILHFTKPSAH